jgi:hypothetical protein|nr:hypothetical protein [uncultured Comamonas sp.]
MQLTIQDSEYRSNLLEALLAEAQHLLALNKHAEIAAINARIAEEVLGWHTEVKDPRRLWRTQNGQPITFKFSWLTCVYFVCKHPWVEGVNRLEDSSFSPGHNYHKDFHDWLLWTRDALLDPEHLAGRKSHFVIVK